MSLVYENTTIVYSPVAVFVVITFGWYSFVTRPQHGACSCSVNKGEAEKKGYRYFYFQPLYHNHELSSESSQLRGVI